HEIDAAQLDGIPARLARSAQRVGQRSGVQRPRVQRQSEAHGRYCTVLLPRRMAHPMEPCLQPPTAWRGAMKRRILPFTIAGLLLLVGVASAQDQKSDKDKDRGVRDVRQGTVRGDRQLRGNVVAVHDSDVIVRGDDNRTYVVNASGVDQSTVQGLKSGQAVSVTARSAGQNGVLVASAVKTESSP